MRFSEILNLVKLNLIQNKFKVLLTSIGIIVGAATIVIVIAVGRGGKADVAEQFRNLNAGALDISYEQAQGSGGFSFGGSRPSSGGSSSGRPNFPGGDFASFGGGEMPSFSGSRPNSNSSGSSSGERSSRGSGFFSGFGSMFGGIFGSAGDFFSGIFDSISHGFRRSAQTGDALLFCGIRMSYLAGKTGGNGGNYGITLVKIIVTLGYGVGVSNVGMCNSHLCPIFFHLPHIGTCTTGHVHLGVVGRFE